MITGWLGHHAFVKCFFTLTLNIIELKNKTIVKNEIKLNKWHLNVYIYTKWNKHITIFIWKQHAFVEKYHDLNVCYYGRPMLNKLKQKLDQNKWPYKTEVATIFTDVTDFKNEQQSLHPNSSYYQMCISKRQKVILLLLILSGNPNLFLALKQYHSLEHAATKNTFFYLDIYVVKEN